jgi:hypothetical protein
VTDNASKKEKQTNKQKTQKKTKKQQPPTNMDVGI